MNKINKINEFYIEYDPEKNNIYDLIRKILRTLPETIYERQKDLDIIKNINNNKITIQIPLNKHSIIIIKIYDNYNHKIPNELLYLERCSDNHYFYKDCYLAYYVYSKYDISLIKMKRAFGDISKIRFSIKDYFIINEMLEKELKKMHDRKLIHMDLKTTNILYLKKNNQYIFGLCDFELINNNNAKIPKEYQEYYKILYETKIPQIYDINFEKKAFDILMKNLINKKNIIYKTV